MRIGSKWGLAGLLVCAIVALPTSAEEDGATIWGPDRASTVKAMKQVVRALGVRSCLYCHVKSEGRVDYEAETEHKEIARIMKRAFVDSLVTRGGGELVLKEEHETLRISARYEPQGEDAGIYITMVEETAGGKPGRAVEGRVDLPGSGQLTCATCHAGSVHFLPQPGEG